MRNYVNVHGNYEYLSPAQVQYITLASKHLEKARDPQRSWQRYREKEGREDVFNGFLPRGSTFILYTNNIDGSIFSIFNFHHIKLILNKYKVPNLNIKNAFVQIIHPNYFDEIPPNSAPPAQSNPSSLLASLALLSSKNIHFLAGSDAASSGIESHRGGGGGEHCYCLVFNW